MRSALILVSFALPGCVPAGLEPGSRGSALAPLPHPGLIAYEDAKLGAPHGGYGAEFGAAVAGAGDVNGDGYDDLIVGSPGYSVGTGAAYVFLGAAGGVDVGSAIQLAASDGAILDSFGVAVAGAGDVNGDGYDDVLVGSAREGSPGVAYLYLGSAAGIDSATELQLAASDGVDDDGFGVAVAGVGDVDGDGYGDVAVGAPSADSGAGAAYLYTGSASGLDASRQQRLALTTSGSSDALGSALAGAGDVNGDGYDDLVVGARGRGTTGAVVLYPGGPSGLGSGTELTATVAAMDDAFGVAVAGVGDVDGDGHDDVLVGASGADFGGSSAGAAFYLPGSAGGLDSAGEAILLPSDSFGSDRFGLAVGGGGDQDGDGYADVVGGAPDDDDAGAGSGAGYTFPGSVAGPVPGGEVKLLASDGAAGDALGTATASVGDLDGDGADDLVLGAPGVDDAGSDSGAVYLFYGECTAVSTWHLDGDGDGFGDPDETTEACGAPTGHVADGSDCDDTDASVYPGAPEIPGDGVDQDCDGEDAVGDTGDTGGGPVDTGDSGDTGEFPSDSETDSDPPDDTCCSPGDTGEGKDPDDGRGCATSGRNAPALAALLLLIPTLARRRCS